MPALELSGSVCVFGVLSWNLCNSLMTVLKSTADIQIDTAVLHIVVIPHVPIVVVMSKSSVTSHPFGLPNECTSSRLLACSVAQPVDNQSCSM